MIKFYHITDGWQELTWFNTGGTRAKRYMQSPDGKYYYFKRSQFKSPTKNKPGKDFKYEFWSEIIAYEIGNFLGFNILRYDIAFDDKNLGCISESMIDSEKEHLVQGMQFLQAYDPDYEPSKKTHQRLYTFQAIEKALKKFRLQGFIEDVVEMIIFDALIGNGDRHQENWGVIFDYTAVTKAIEKLRPYTTQDLEGVNLDDIYDQNLIQFSPIYDNGSSLGRELTDRKVNDLLTSRESLDRYIKRGLAEIHWIDNKVSHFDLVGNLLESSHRNIVNNCVGRIVSKFNKDAVEDLINRIDIWIPEFLQTHKIPYPRKKLILEIINLRFETLKEITNA